MYILTAQRPHTGVHNSTGHTSRVHNQTHNKEYEDFNEITRLVYKSQQPSRWSAHMALQSDSNAM